MKANRVLRARGVWTSSGWLDEGSVVLDRDERTILEVRPGRAEDGQLHEGLLIPGLINAHLHLELGGLAGRLPRGGVGFRAWATALIEARREPDTSSDHARVLAQGAADLRAAGTAGVSDISNEGDAAQALMSANIRGVVQHELMGFSPSEKVWSQARHAGTREAGVITRPAAHAPYSTHPEIIQATAGLRLGAPSTLHLAEDEAERHFLMRGEGVYAEWLDAMGVSWRHLDVPGCDPVSYLDRLGVLGRGQMVVHGVDLRPEEQRALAQSGSPLCLCPRSNLWIGGRLPDVPGLMDAGVRLCLGTDSLASCDSLDVLEEIPVLAEAFPDIPVGVWLDMATRGGAEALGIPWGRLQEGTAPGLVLLHGVGEIGRLKDPTPLERSWFAEPGACPWTAGVHA
jgi:cytosine/adenosine deaminase-related metal-dependent hydrolase